MEHNVKKNAGLVKSCNEALCDDQVPRAAHREKLCETLHHSEEHSFPQIQYTSSLSVVLMA